MEDSSKESKLARVMELITEAMAIMATLDEEKFSLVDFAEEGLGTDVSPRDLAVDELGCAESVSILIRKVLPDFPIVTGTWTLWDKIRRDSRFIKVLEPIEGDIIISPTGTVANPPFPGHTGIMLDSDNIMANNSANGVWQSTYRIDTWIDRWGEAGFPIYFYRIK